MSKIYSVFTFLIFVLLSLSLSAQEVDVSGDWELTMETPQGEITMEVHFDQDGENLTVTITEPRGEIEGDGTISGNEIEWTVTRSTPSGEMTMTYTGTVDGETMSGEVQIGNFGSAQWKATRT